MDLFRCNKRPQRLPHHRGGTKREVPHRDPKQEHAKHTADHEASPELAVIGLFVHLQASDRHGVAGSHFPGFFFGIADNCRLAVSAPAQHLHLDDPEMAIWTNVQNSRHNGIKRVHQMAPHYRIRRPGQTRSISPPAVDFQWCSSKLHMRQSCDPYRREERRSLHRPYRGFWRWQSGER